MTQPTVADLLAAVERMSAQVGALSVRVEALESELSMVRADLPAAEVPDEVIIAISAAVAAFLGHRARLKQVRYRTGGDAWTQQGRAAVQRRDVIHGVR